MLNDFLQDQAALFTSGAFNAEDRQQFELLLEFHDELRAFVTELAEVSAALMLAGPPHSVPSPRAELKARIMESVGIRAQRRVPEGMVMCGRDGLVQWINPAFTAMCGYGLDELRGKKLGPILQGAATDVQAAERMRQAVHAYKPCREEILNYHKSGAPYWVEINITPILDDLGQPLYLVARERELTDRIAA